MFVFVGLAVGNGMSDPATIFNFGEYLYQIGLVDGNTRDVIQTYEQAARNAIAKEQWIDALEVSANNII